MGLVVHAVAALDDRLLDLVDPLGGLARLGIDPEDRVVMHLRLEALRPAAVATQPGASIRVQLFSHACTVNFGASGKPAWP